MRDVCKQTLFYSDIDEAKALFGSDAFGETMNKVVAFCVEYGIVGEAPTISYDGSGDFNVHFDPSYLTRP